jgi:hypothetical protein
VPSTAIRRRCRQNTPSIAGVPTGHALWSNSSLRGLSPRRPRAREIAPSVGTVYPPQPPRAHRNPLSKPVSTRTYPLPKSSHSASAKYTINLAGSALFRRSFTPASSIAATTRSSGKTVASKPIDTPSVSRPGSTALFSVTP